MAIRGDKVSARHVAVRRAVEMGTRHDLSGAELFLGDGWRPRSDVSPQGASRPGTRQLFSSADARREFHEIVCRATNLELRTRVLTPSRPVTRRAFWGEHGVHTRMSIACGASSVLLLPRSTACRVTSCTAPGVNRRAVSNYLAAEGTTFQPAGGRHAPRFAGAVPDDDQRSLRRWRCCWGSRNSARFSRWHRQKFRCRRATMPTAAVDHRVVAPAPAHLGRLGSQPFFTDVVDSNRTRRCRWMRRASHWRRGRHSCWGERHHLLDRPRWPVRLAAPRVVLLTHPHIRAMACHRAARIDRINALRRCRPRVGACG